MTVFGPRLSSFDVETAVLDTLRAWTPTYVDQANTALSIPTRKVKPPRAYIQTKDFVGWPADRLTCVQVACTGHAQEPVKDTDGYRTWWQVEVYCVVEGQSRDATRRKRAVFEWALPMVLLQHPSLGGLAEAIDWMGGGNADVPIEANDQRTLQGFVDVYSVEVPAALDPNAGPAEPLPDVGSAPPVYPDDPTVETVDITLEPEA